jgi:hypothetical protein
MVHEGRFKMMLQGWKVQRKICYEMVVDYALKESA